jgi:hypothetical protein
MVEMKAEMKQRMRQERLIKSSSPQWWQKIGPEDFWYLIGLIATDGCLSSDGRHIDITSKEYAFLELIKQRCAITSSISRKTNGRGQFSHHIQIDSRPLYKQLLEIGLMPKKSKQLGPLLVPTQYFADFFRGVVDGDGCIRTWRHPSNGGEQWSLRIVGASRPFLEWLRFCCENFLGVLGKVHDKKQNDSSMFVLKFGKMAARNLLSRCYYAGAGMALNRKALLAERCCASERGWSKSKTIVSGYDV